MEVEEMEEEEEEEGEEEVQQYPSLFQSHRSLEEL